MFASESISGKEESCWGGLCSGRLGGDADWETFGEVDGNIFWFVGGGEDGVFGELPHSNSIVSLA